MINERVQGCIADTLTNPNDVWGLISKPSRQLTDSCLIVNYLDARML